ncbi:hypothetical protein LSTR_LSTR002180 [Laodelphax striatellus]|uniref:Hepatic leukemia factor n=1 Tax=Laodelphax striatellus TaxID=195883 RepID=A0A482XR15_LAOST|nr:hypothetical protein LSTR_LSTR002180 [Laodelphax striatellus]
MYEAKCLVMDYQPHQNANMHQNVPPQHQIHHQFHQLHPLAPDSSSRWTQYQQLWRQHHQMIINGKSCGKEIVPVEKKDENELWSNVEAQAAFLGPNLWEKTLPYDADLKYVDLDEFLSENGIPVENGGGGMGAGAQPAAPGGGSQPAGLKQLPVADASGGRISPSGSNSQQSLMLQTKRERSPSPSEPMSPLNISPPSPADSSQFSTTTTSSVDLTTLSFASSSRDFDPRTRAFSDEELKPQPMVKKSRKQVRTATFVQMV